MLFRSLLNTDKDSVIHENLVVGTAFPEIPATDAKEGYELDGWYAADENGEKTGTEKVTNFPATVTDNAYYVAVWKAKAPTTGKLTITKKVIGIANLDKEFTFKVHPFNGTVPDVTPYGIYNAADGDSVTIDLPTGWYQVFEPSDSAKIPNYKCKTEYELKDTEGNEAFGGIGVYVNVPAGGTAEVVVTNTYTPTTADLTIVKELNISLPQEMTFKFTVRTGAEQLVEEAYITIEAGKTSGTAKVTGLNIGQTYTVREVITNEISLAGYSLKIDDGKTVKISGDNDSVTITNAYTPLTTTSVTAELDITKNVVRERGSRRPGSADFTFEASYVDPSSKEKEEVLVELDSLTIKTTGGEKRYTKGWTLTIPEKAFDEEGWAVLVISEVNGKLSGWTYDKEVYTLYVSKNGEIFNGGIPQALNDNEEVVPGINLEFTNSYYKRTSSPNPPENKPVKSVKTGDMGIAMYAMTSLLSLGGAALVIKKRKDEE